jgi:hypothetical protein
VRRAFAALVLVLAWPGHARADGPIAVAVALGPSAERLANSDVTYYDNDNGYRATTTLHLDLGYRIEAIAALGIHVGLSRSANLGTGDTSSDGQRAGYAPFEAGFGGTWVMADRLWIAPWVGVLDILPTSSGSIPDRSLAFGFDAGVDLYQDTGHRVGVFAGLTHSGDWTYTPFSENPSNGYTAVTIGAAYRYW